MVAETIYYIKTPSNTIFKILKIYFIILSLLFVFYREIMQKLSEYKTRSYSIMSIFLFIRIFQIVKNI